MASIDTNTRINELVEKHSDLMIKLGKNYSNYVANQISAIEKEFIVLTEMSVYEYTGTVRIR